MGFMQLAIRWRLTGGALRKKYDSEMCRTFESSEFKDRESRLSKIKTE